MNLQKVKILKGLPASGKSTYAKMLVDSKTETWKRINKDDLRSMLDNSNFSKRNEKFILDIRNYLITKSLQEGFNVVVDDTNLNPIHIEQITELVKPIEAEIVDFTAVSLEDCIERDKKRPNSVGEKIIRDMYYKFIYKGPEKSNQNSSLPRAIIVDIDGTLAYKHKDRSIYDFNKCEDDYCNENLRFMLYNLNSLGYNIILVSGRDSSCREQTIHWLSKYKVPYKRLYMRAEEDKRSDYLVKEEIFNNNIKDKFNVIAVFDDRPQVIRLWRKLGLPTYDVGIGTEF